MPGQVISLDPVVTGCAEMSSPQDDIEDPASRFRGRVVVRPYKFSLGPLRIADRILHSSTTILPSLLFKARYR